jgi:hypothetical protein
LTRYIHVQTKLSQFKSEEIHLNLNRSKKDTEGVLRYRVIIKLLQLDMSI